MINVGPNCSLILNLKTKGTAYAHVYIVASVGDGVHAMFCLQGFVCTHTYVVYHTHICLWMCVSLCSSNARTVCI